MNLDTLEETNCPTFDRPEPARAQERVGGAKVDVESAGCMHSEVVGRRPDTARVSIRFARDGARDGACDHCRHAARDTVWARGVMLVCTCMSCHTCACSSVMDSCDQTVPDEAARCFVLKAFL